MNEYEKKQDLLETLQACTDIDIRSYKSIWRDAKELGLQSLSLEKLLTTLEELRMLANLTLKEDVTHVVAKGRSKQGGYEFEIYHHEHEHKYSFRVFRDKECTKVIIDSKDIKKEKYDYEGDAAEAVNAFFAGLNFGK